MKIKNIILGITLLLSGTSVLAQGGATGPLTWNINNGSLTISGNGAMPDYNTWNHWGPYEPWYDYRDNFTAVVIEDGVTRIGNCAFYWCETITSIRISNSVTSIGEAAFLHCSSLSSVTLPNSVTNIEKGAFSDCLKLASINIPDGVTNIGERVFEGCHSLISINIPNSVTSIGMLAFSNCSSLTSITLPNNITQIGYGFFFNCFALASIILPSDITSIEKWAFYGCTALKLITNLNPVPVAIDTSVFEGVDKSACTLKVPAGSVAAYKNAEVWKEFMIESVGIEPIEKDVVNVYPNPTRGELRIKSEKLSMKNICVFDMAGRLVLEMNHVDNNEARIDLSGYADGVYFLKVDGQMVKVVKR